MNLYIRNILAVLIFLFLCLSIATGQDKEKYNTFIDNLPDNFPKLWTREKEKVRNEIVKACWEMLSKEDLNNLSKEYLEKLENTQKWLYDQNDTDATSIAKELERMPDLFRFNMVLAREKTRKKYSFPPVEVSAEGYSKLSKEEKSDILCDIAEASFLVLAQEVPDKGLENSKGSIEKIISARKWLEQTNEPLARILDMRLQRVVDSCLVEEIFKKEFARHNKTYDMNSMGSLSDDKIIQDLLKKNEIDEKGYINFALSFDTEIANLCRKQNFTAQDFLSNRVFQKDYPELSINMEGTRVGKLLKEKDLPQKILLKYFDDLDHTEGYFLFYEDLINSRKDAIYFLLPTTLCIIDDAKDTRLFARINFDNKGFVDKFEGSVDDIINDKSFEQRYQKEMSKSKEKRMTIKKGLGVKRSDESILSRIAHRISSRIEHSCFLKSESESEWRLSSNNLIFIFELCPFIRDRQIILTISSGGGLTLKHYGSWLDGVE